MQIKLDFRTGIPIYVQIMEQIKHQITTGTLRAGDQLPTVRQMATDLRVNFNTVARAYRLLDEAGIISTQHGRGTYILEDADTEEHVIHHKHTLEELTRQYLSAVARLNFSPAEVEDEFQKNLEAWKSEVNSENGRRDPTNQQHSER